MNESKVVRNSIVSDNVSRYQLQGHLKISQIFVARVAVIEKITFFCIFRLWFSYVIAVVLFLNKSRDS